MAAKLAHAEPSRLAREPYWRASGAKSAGTRATTCGSQAGCYSRGQHVCKRQKQGGGRGQGHNRDTRGANSRHGATSGEHGGLLTAQLRHMWGCCRSCTQSKAQANMCSAKRQGGGVVRPQVPRPQRCGKHSCRRMRREGKLVGAGAGAAAGGQASSHRRSSTACPCRRWQLTCRGELPAQALCNVRRQLSSGSSCQLSRQLSAWASRCTLSCPCPWLPWPWPLPPLRPPRRQTQRPTSCQRLPSSWPGLPSWP